MPARTTFIHADGSSCELATDCRRATAQLAKRTDHRSGTGAFDVAMVTYRRQRQDNQVVYIEVVEPARDVTEPEGTHVSE